MTPQIDLDDLMSGVITPSHGSNTTTGGSTSTNPPSTPPSSTRPRTYSESTISSTTPLHTQNSSHTSAMDSNSSRFDQHFHTAMATNSTNSSNSATQHSPMNSISQHPHRKTLILGQFKFQAIMTVTTSHENNPDDFTWTLVMKQVPRKEKIQNGERSIDANKNMHCYKCTITPSLYVHLTHQYRLSGPEVFYHVIREALFERRAISFGYYFGDDRRREPTSQRDRLILEIVVELNRTRMKFIILLDPLLPRTDHSHREDDVNGSNSNSMMDTDGSTDLLMSASSGSGQELNHINEERTPIEMNSQNYDFQQESKHSSSKHENPSARLIDVIKDMELLKQSHRQEQERSHALMNYIERLENRLNELTDQVRMLTDQRLSTSSNEPPASRKLEPLENNPEIVDDILSQQTPSSSSMSQHQYPSIAPSESSSEPRILPQNIIPNYELFSQYDWITNNSYVFSEWSPSRTHSDLIISNDNRTIQFNGSNNWCSSLGNVIFDHRIHEWSIRIDQFDRYKCVLIGISDPNHPLEESCGSTLTSYAFNIADGKVYHDSSAKTYFTSGEVKKNAIVGVVLDLDKRTLSFRLNGQDLGIAFRNVSGPCVPCVSLSTNAMISLVVSGIPF